MTKNITRLLSLSFLLTMANASSDVHWAYDGAGAPANWGSIDEKFHTCSEGVNQSPINLTGFVDAMLPAIKFNYNLQSNEILNNGHTIQINMDAGSSIEVDGISFELKQFPFHTPSENNINGNSYPLEAHFVHASANGKLAVVAVMFEVGESNKVLEGLWKKMPLEAGVHNKDVNNQINTLLPKNRDYYRFNGSLTTPPCTEGVRWLVMKDSISMSKEQLALFQKVMKRPNNRPIQATNARVILD